MGGGGPYAPVTFRPFMVKGLSPRLSLQLPCSLPLYQEGIGARDSRLSLPVG